MPNDRSSKQFDLEDRTFRFAKGCRSLVKQLPKTMGNIEDGKQLTQWRYAGGEKNEISTGERRTYEDIWINC